MEILKMKYWALFCVAVILTDKLASSTHETPEKDISFFLHPSEFPDVIPPSIKFTWDTTDTESRRKYFSHLNSVICSEHLQPLFESSGLTSVNFTQDSNDWLVFINCGPDRRNPDKEPGKIIKSQQQKHNLILGCESMDFKDEFLKKYRNYQESFNWDWHLPAFITPEETPKFLESAKVGSLWVYKPSKGHVCLGIEMFRFDGKFTKESQGNSTAVVQQLLLNPFLLPGKVKPEIRFNILITSVHPLRIYIYNEGITKHIYNMETLIPALEQGNGTASLLEFMDFDRRSNSRHFWSEIRKQFGYYRAEKLLREMEDIMIKAILMGERDMFDEVQRLGFSPKGFESYQYFSMDFFLDTNLKPYLIEMNRFPSCMMICEIYDFGKRMMQDMVNLVGYKYREGHEDARILGAGNKTVSWEGFKLSGEDVLSLMEALDETKRMRTTGFRRLFPTRKTRKYFQFISSDLNTYKLQHEWNDKIGDKGKSLLRELWSKLE